MPVGKGKRRWLASERIAFRLLEERGYEILETHRKVVVEGVEVGEVDAVARGPDGSLYAVEVKAGRLDVHGVRQAYANAVVLGYKPLVVCKGFADDAAQKLAEKLGVEVIELEDVFLVDAEELEDIVRGAAAEAVADALSLLLEPPRIPPGLLEAVKAIAGSSSPLDAAKRSGLGLREVAEAAKLLKEKSLLARKGGWRGVALAAALALAGLRLTALLGSLRDAAERLAEEREALLGRRGREEG